MLKRSQKTFYVRVGLAGITLGLVFLSFFFIPGRAWAVEGCSSLLLPFQPADNYTIDRVDIEAQALTNGSLHVIERQICTFDGTGTGILWVYDELPKNARLIINSVHIASTDKRGMLEGQWQTLPKTAFRTDFRKGKSLPTAAYAHDIGNQEVYCFFQAFDGRVMVEIDYTLEGGILSYRDIAEIDWAYVCERAPVASENISLKVILPVPVDAAVVPDENVYAWGHGPQEGSFVIEHDGTITYHVSQVPVGNFSLAHIAFPASWLSNIPVGASHVDRSKVRLNHLLSEEKDWVDSEHYLKMMSYHARIISAIVCCALFLLVLMVLVRFVRKPRTDESMSLKELFAEHPGLVGCAYRRGRVSLRDLVAEVLHLVQTGQVSIEYGTRKNLKEHLVRDYRVVLREDTQQKDRLDAATVCFLFPKAQLTLNPDEATNNNREAVLDCVSTSSSADRAQKGIYELTDKQLSADTPDNNKGEKAVWLGQLVQRASTDKKTFCEKYYAWCASFRSALSKAGYLDEQVRIWRRRFYLFSGLYGVFGIAFGFFITDVVIPILFIVTGVLVVLVAGALPRLSDKGLRMMDGLEQLQFSQVKARVSNANTLNPHKHLYASASNVSVPKPHKHLYGNAPDSNMLAPLMRVSANTPDSNVLASLDLLYAIDALPARLLALIHQAEEKKINSWPKDRPNNCPWQKLVMPTCLADGSVVASFVKRCELALSAALCEQKTLSLKQRKRDKGAGSNEEHV